MSRLVMVVLITLLVVVSGAPAATPKQLYKRLLTSPYTAPSGYYNAKVGAGNLNERDLRNHEIGNVVVELSSDAAAYFFVFPSRTWAASWQRDKPVSDSDIKVISRRSMGQVPGYGALSKWENLTIEGENALGKKVRNGVTLMSVRKANIVVGAATFSTENTASGDIPATIKILRSALKHLAKVQSS